MRSGRSEGGVGGGMASTLFLWPHVNSHSRCARRGCVGTREGRQERESGQRAGRSRDLDLLGLCQLGLFERRGLFFLRMPQDEKMRTEMRTILTISIPKPTPNLNPKPEP